ncbi:MULTISPECIES: tyrosine--tRNA ligase [Hymenobacter]|uniref:tyrosine--tRNA ligase n=1 Tax=Hymenobacter TaxID=89966 RepID=UPI0010584E92|nr:MULTISPECIES: tyrosine--tRNA ligase [Hymenobacter]QIL74720.1 tyrosine--tRNA ligase [Hymenobacter sp. HDW8]
MNLLDELRWRGMLHDTMPGTAEHLAENQPISGYIGFDPTAASLHIGNLATIMLLVHLQRAGHRPVALVGGATGMIGDPSGKSAERNLLNEDTLRGNQAGIRAQLEKFLEFNDSPTGAVVVNNYDWFKEIGFLQFLRDVGKHITVNYMMAKDSVKRRLGTPEAEGEQRADGLSYTEFSYQLLQGYDFSHLYKTLNCTLQMGGSDQWGNITTGTELIRRLDGGKAFALTCPLVTKADGTKFGKSEGGNVWLSPQMTSPYQFYQFWLNAADADTSRLIRVFTLLSEAEILELETQHAPAPHQRILQKALAKDVTIRVHSLEAYEAAVAASEILFGKGELEDLQRLDEATLLDVFAGVPRLEVSREQASSLLVADLLSEATQYQIFPSKSEVKKMIQGGGVSLNRQKVAAADQSVSELPLLQNKYLVAQKGKKNYFLIALV